MQQSFVNRYMRQAGTMIILIIMVILVLRELYIFLPGLLGAITTYILSRNSYFQLIYHRKWKKGRTAGLYLLFFFLIPSALIYFSITMLGHQLRPFLSDPAVFFSKMKDAVTSMQDKTQIHFVSADFLTGIQEKMAGLIPRLVNDTVILLTNFAILLFVLYYMLVHGSEMESYLRKIIPLKKVNIDLLASETKRIVRASAIGIPLISLIQGITAGIGYIIFGVDDFILWGFLTGVFAFFPVIGTMIIWIPLVIALYSGGHTWNATGLMIYSIIVTGNIDYVSRITILKKLGNIHPVVAVFGVIAGLGLFGFIGFIFGPLLVSYIILIFRIYRSEFANNNGSEQPAARSSEDNQLPY
ncbi:MAG: AI-2E family transporter [Chitinophagaceae bacterium]|nr:AI-2E family transporter [Chitinophagaceae bacterium]